MFAKIADNIARILMENKSIDDDNFEICRYGLQQGLTIILNIVSTILIGMTLGTLWQAILFTTLYVPLRSNAGGYHARTATRCYVYSILLMIAVLLAMKYVTVLRFICVIMFIISCVIILFLAPVEDANKPLDIIEQVVYRKRTYVITIIEITLYVVTQLIEAIRISDCIMWVFMTMSGILIVGKLKNRIANSHML